jgi:nucleotide-binding universal stress UspA family protein
MTKLIAFVDGSAYSKSVCDHAAWIAGRTGLGVAILHVLNPHAGPNSSDLSGAISLGARSELMEELAGLDAERARVLGQQGRAILEDASQIFSQVGVTDVTTQMRHGDFAQTVGELEPGAAMVLIGKRGEGHVADPQARIGSHLERILRAATKPVLIASRAFKPIGKVLVAWDGQSAAMNAVDHIARDPLFAGLEVRLVYVGAADDNRTQELEAARSRLAAAGVNAQAQIVTGEVVPVLSEMAEREAFGLIVMGSYGHSKLRSFVLGSKTSEMIKGCKLPLLLTR